MVETSSPSRASLFSSKRERNLWLVTLIAIAGIYLTLGLASTLAAWLDAHNLLTAGFVTGMLAVMLVILTRGLSSRPGGLEFGLALGIGAVYFMVILRLALPERSHLFEYSVVAVFIYEALLERKKQGRRVRFAPLLATTFATLVGTTDEIIQLFLPNRVFDPVDIAFNALVSVMAIATMVVLGWARRWSRRGKSVNQTTMEDHRSRVDENRFP